jgi:putative Holliday junction resolvase
MRILGIDYGLARTGLAIGDSETRLAFPLAVLEGADMEALAEKVAATAEAEDCERVVVGMPTRLTGAGEAGETERRVTDFIAALAARTDLPIDTEDERFSTAYAERLKREAGPALKIGTDALAAAAILETYMERLREQGTGNRRQDS